VTEGLSQKIFNRFDRYEKQYVMLCLGLYVFINNTINASSDWMEATRDNNIPEFSFWEPFCWEYSSALSTLLLFPILIWWFRRVPFELSRLRRFLLLHLVGTVVFSALHVSLMVLFRELVYALVGGNYNFGAVASEFFYEYRKDAWGYLFLMALYYIYRFIYARLKGEASLISQQHKAPLIVSSNQNYESVEQNSDEPLFSENSSNAPDHLLVKKLDKEFLVKVADIEWLEAAGNYVNLHSGGRIYPLRSTLVALLPRIDSKGFARIHRSYGVNINLIESIASLPSGDGEVHLQGGQTLSLSRRYKEAFKDRLK
jgi:hypothetical protein